jgi:hypothetical protein
MGCFFLGKPTPEYYYARSGDFNFYISPEEAFAVPKAWRGKPIYRDVFGHKGGYALPSCYDFYALAHCPIDLPIPNLSEKLEIIAAFLSDPRFQSTIGRYGWDRPRRRCYAAGRVFLACSEPCRLVLFLEWGARFISVRSSQWFQKGMASLEACRTDRGTYRFPSNLMMEKTGYYIYGGAHMGLGEERSSAQALELESTFRMLLIQKRML